VGAGGGGGGKYGTDIGGAGYMGIMVCGAEIWGGADIVLDDNDGSDGGALLVTLT
jgi:hypothetical protein